jgi:hypothetical protein
MSEIELDALLERMPQIADVLQKFASESIQSEVFQALMRAFDGAPAHTANGGSNGVDETETSDEDSTDSTPPIKQTAKKLPAKKATAAKAKQTFTIDKALDLVNGGSKSFKAFVEEKKPANNHEKCLVSVYWLTRVAAAPKPATADQVYTCFKDAGWKVPGDLINALQQAGTKGWLDTKKRDDLKVVVGGENHVEHDMPAKPKEKAA